jgi:hypothetical protein
MDQRSCSVFMTTTLYIALRVLTANFSFRILDCIAKNFIKNFDNLSRSRSTITYPLGMKLRFTFNAS